MSSFVIELVSNASTGIYQNNTLSSFTNFLPEQVSLQDGDWEVALMEIGYPSWYNNINEGLIRYKANIAAEGFMEFRLKKGLYRSVYDVTKAITEGIEENEQTENPNDKEPGLVITQDPFSGKMLFHFAAKAQDMKSTIHLASYDVANILGFPSPALIPSSVKESMLPADIQRIHSIMVYTDIIEHSLIGDVKAPILRCFPMTTKMRKGYLELTQFMNYQTFEKLQFRKVLKSSFHSIKVELRDATGMPIPFVGVGLTRVTLMFRRVAKH